VSDLFSAPVPPAVNDLYGQPRDGWHVEQGVIDRTYSRWQHEAAKGER
jgi:hypothetical protein